MSVDWAASLCLGLVEDSHCAARDSYKYSNSGRNAPHHYPADSASDSADSSGVGSSNAGCGVDTAAAVEVGFVRDTGGPSGMGVGAVMDDDWCAAVLDVVQ